MNNRLSVSVLGCGRWGSFLAWYANELGHNVTSYGPEKSKEYKILKQTRANEYVKYPDNIKVSGELSSTIGQADIIIISVPAQVFAGFIKSVAEYDLQNKTIVLCMKGIEIETGRRLSQIAIDSGIDKNALAVWVGPGHIQEFVKKKPNCMLIDAYNIETTKNVIENFKSPLIRFYYGQDIIGSEIGAAAKNVMGIVAGMLDGMGLVTLKGALMARGAHEVARLIKALGGNENSAYGLCHLGDYETTLFSEHSHNRRFGEMFVKGENFEKLAEGVYTAKALSVLAQKYNVDMPITNAVNRMIHQNVSPQDTLKELFERDLKHEFNY